MSDDVVSRAKAALEGVRPAPWVAEREMHSLDDGTTETVWDVDGPHGGWVARCQDYGTAEFVAAARSLIPELVAEHELLVGRLKAFGRDCVHHGDMTPAAERMLIKILDGER